MAKSKRSCYLCGTQYEYCDCNRQPKYMATFCSENCRDIFKSLCSYGTGAISAEDCKELLDCCDLNVESYKESTRNVIEKVYAEAKPIIEISEESVEIIVDESADQVSDIEEPTEIIVEETQEINVEEVPERKRKRNHEVVLEESE